MDKGECKKLFALKFIQSDINYKLNGVLTG